jgi:hypothetical protein
MVRNPFWLLKVLLRSVPSVLIVVALPTCFNVQSWVLPAEPEIESWPLERVPLWKC